MLDNFADEVTPYKKKSKKKTQKKSDHKHEFELIEKEKTLLNHWFTHKEVCKICEKERDSLHIQWEEQK